MPVASMMRLASSAFSLKSERSRARRSAARGRPVHSGGRPRRTIRAASAQTASAQPTRGSRSQAAP